MLRAKVYGEMWRMKERNIEVWETPLKKKEALCYATEYHISLDLYCTLGLIAFWQDVLREANAATVNKIFQFLSATDPPAFSSQIPAGLVPAGLATSSSGSVFGPVELEARKLEGCIVIPISAADCPNLKTALKAIIRNGTARRRGGGVQEGKREVEGEGDGEDDDGEEEVVRSKEVGLIPIALYKEETDTYFRGMN